MEPIKEEISEEENIYLEPNQENPKTPENASIEEDKLDSLDMRIKEYFETHTNICLYILTPCFGGLCYTSFVSSLMSTVEAMKQYNIETHIEFCNNDSLVSRARNNLIARAMHDPKTTHMLFIDNDIQWDPVDILKLIITDKDLVGGVYPLKKYNWNKLSTKVGQDSLLANKWIEQKNKSVFKDTISDEDLVQFRSLAYNINYKDNKLHIQNNLAEVKHLATGFMMIKRCVIEKMQKGFPYTKYIDDVNFLNGDENTQAYALFDCGVENNHYYSEDWLFCERWANMGGDIFVEVTINLSHTGTEQYRGCFLSTIM
jgi:hypothetical protein